MEKIYFNYSLKNIPVPSRTSYKLQLIDKIEILIKRMRWKAHFFLNKFRKLNDSFQEKMKSDISEIKSSPNVFIFADKTSNIYKAAPREYNKLLKDNITKFYNKSRYHL